MLPILDTEKVSASFDEQTGISYIIYRGILDAESSEILYGWVNDLLEMIGPDATHGVIMDFREVKHFKRENISTTRRKSNELNNKTDNNNHPVAMIISTPYQEQMAVINRSLSPNEERVGIVRSMKEAMTFIQNWHKNEATQIS